MGQFQLKWSFFRILVHNPFYRYFVTLTLEVNDKDGVMINKE